MLTIRNLNNDVRASRRRIGLALPVFGALVISACGGNTSLTPTGAPATTATPAAATATPGPASIQATLTGDASVTGPLVLANVHFVTCDSPSLKGESIFAYENATDSSIGVLLTIRAGAIAVRLARGSSTTYTERLFDGTGVTSFNPASGAKFSSSVTESTPAGTNKGTLGSLTSISGSVSCGTFTPGSGSVTVAGDTAGGTLSGALTSIRVLCGSNTAGGYVTVSGLSRAGSTPVMVSVLGGIGSATFYVVVQTATAGYQYSSTTAGIVTLANGHATYNGTAKETAASTGAAGRSVTVSGTATCGVSG
jgi:hypothetical protein